MTTPAAVTATSYQVTDLATGQPAQVSSDELRRIFERDGVVILPGFLSDADMAPLRAELDVQYARRAATAATSHNGVGKYEKFACDVMVWAPIAEKSPPFMALNDSHKLRNVTEAVIGGGYISSPSGLVMFSVGGGRGQAWHQDCPPEGGETEFNLNRLFYTDDVSLEDGAIVFVPGSHKAGRIPPGGHQEPIAGERVLEPRAGTLVLLHGHVYHRVTPNLNQKPRTSINFRAFPAGTSTSVTCIGVYRNGEVNFCDTNKTHDGKPAPMQPAMM